MQNVYMNADKDVSGHLSACEMRDALQAIGTAAELLLYSTYQLLYRYRTAELQ